MNQGNSPDIVKVSDLDQFSETIGALNTLGFTQNEVTTDLISVSLGKLISKSIGERHCKSFGCHSSSG